MRIEAFGALVAVVWLTAVLCTRLVAASNQTLTFSSRKPRDHHLGDQFTRWTSDESTTRRMTYPEMQSLIREESDDDEDDGRVACCPSIREMVEPKGGSNQQDMYVELYRDGGNTQRFYEYSCRPDVLDKPCRFIDRKLQAQSKCVQKFTYAYAIIQSSQQSDQIRRRRRHLHSSESTQPPQQHQFPAFPGNGDTSSWTLDYIKVRNGCRCEITPKPKNKKLAAMKVKRTRSRRHHAARATSRTTLLDFSPEV